MTYSEESFYGRVKVKKIITNETIFTEINKKLQISLNFMEVHVFLNR